jgi:tetratricopeptide (TPR) repeat protein
MNRWRPIQVLCILSLCALPARAAETAPAQTPHDHAHDDVPGHSHKRERVAPKDETTVDYFWRKSDEAFHAGDYERAIGCHKAIVVLKPDEIESYSVGAWLLWSLGKGDEALEFIDRGLKKNPDNWEMWEAAGQQYDLQKKFPEAKTAYVRSVALAPKDAEAQMVRRRLAHAAERTGDLALSAQTWHDLVRDFPNEAVNKNNLARVEKLQSNKAA